MNFKIISASGLALFLIGFVPMAPAAVVHDGLMDAQIVYADPPGPQEPNPSEDNNNAQGSENGKGHQKENPGKGHENHNGFGHGHKPASPN